MPQLVFILHEIQKQHVIKKKNTHKLDVKHMVNILQLYFPLQKFIYRKEFV